MSKAVGIAVAALALSVALIAAATGDVASSMLGMGGGSAPSADAIGEIPPAYLVLYEEAATTCPGLDWVVLAGIGKIETNHGQSSLPGVASGANSAGAQGPMQFEPATFAEYDEPAPAGGVEPPSPYDPVDAIYAAARMLCANGAAGGANVHGAIFAFNHSDTYVADVLAVAATYTAPTEASDGTATASGGQWTPAIGEQIADRALQWLGWPYSYDAGNASGPTYGRAVDYDSRNDASVYGFDCSGLTLYALAPWEALDHYSATQYSQAGSYHPAIAQLLPGDLVFWSDDGTIAGIGHVAIYLGNNQVVQAPYSGAYIETTPLSQVEPGYYGATRPLT